LLAEVFEDLNLDRLLTMNLQSTKQTVGFRVQTTDRRLVGHVTDYYFSTGVCGLWQIDYVVVDARGLLPGKLLLISPQLFRFDLELRLLTLCLTEDQVRESPILSEDEFKRLRRPTESKMGSSPTASSSLEANI
jgi:hypothetical protein